MGINRGNDAEKVERAEAICRIKRYLETDDGKVFVQETLPERGADGHYVLFVHGNTFPSSADFDLPVPGYSLVEHLAGRGVSCCMFDHRGYGRSTKPATGMPIGIETKSGDLEKVFRFLRDQRGATTITLLGLSSGCNTIAAFLSGAKVEVKRVVFMGPCYLYNDILQRVVRKTRLLRGLRTLTGRSKSPYVGFTHRALQARLYRGEEDIMDLHVFDEFVRQAMAADPKSKRLVSPVLSFLDVDHRHEAWQRMFDAATLRGVMVLMIRGSRDEICCERTAKSFVDDAMAAGAQVTEKIIPDRKHDLHLYRDHAEVFEAITSFVRP